MLPSGSRRGLLTTNQQDLFLREARVAAAIRHLIVAIHDTGIDQGTVYICSELIDGVTLPNGIASRAILLMPLQR